MENTKSITQNKNRRIKGLNEIIENLSTAIEYCREYLASDFIQLEPELSACVNRFKYDSIFIKELRKSNIFLQFYPESNKNIFSRTWKTKFHRRLCLYIYIKNVPGFSLFLDLIKCVKS
jgi:hypothetical protein